MISTFRNINLWLILISDTILIAAAYWGAYLIRFENNLSSVPRQAFVKTVWWIVPLYLACLAMFNLYRGMWRYTSVLDSLNLFKAVVPATAVSMTVVFLLYRFDGFSRSVFIINGILVFLIIGGFRIFIRLLYIQPKGYDLSALFRKRTDAKKKLLIIGAGSAAEKLIRELQENKNLEYDLMGLVDDNPNKYRQRLHGVPVLGRIDQIGGLVDRYQVDEIAIAIPSASPRKMRRIIDACKKTQIIHKTVPGIGDIIAGRVAISKLRAIRYEDLLHRSPTPIDNDLVCGYLTDKRVMVTGGAGSIGSELCRQIAAFSPQTLIIVERNESALYELALDIQRSFPELEVVSALAAIQNTERMEHIFRQYRPEVVFHAAAYKHVPMMENHPWEAIFNNVVGSHVVLKMCRRFAIERCVIVSTDKAVKPTNVMGATKRFVELLTQSYAAATHTRYMAVRFGNVLGSVGSVLPLFQKQIAAGGPVTVTDPRMTRFFMTIPEACSLILQSGAYGHSGEIFVLKMGTPVRIDDMARDLITLSGYRPGKDIQIQYTGLRPGEKLYEELITQAEGIRRTAHEDIMVLEADRRIAISDMEAHVDTLVAFAKQGDSEQIKQHLCTIIPEYRPWTECQIDSSDGDGETVPPEPQTPIRQARHVDRPTAIPRLSFHQVAAEDRLLLQLLSVDTNRLREIPIDAVPTGQWENVIQRSIGYQVAPLLYLRLKRTGKIDRLPLKIRERLRKIYLYFAQVGVRHQHWIVKALNVMAAYDVPALLLNGVHLGENVYRNVAARPLSAVSLLVPKEDRNRAHHAIKRAAEVLKGTGLNFHAAVDLNWSDLKQRLPVQEIWSRARDATISNRPVKVLCPEDLLLYLCLKLSFDHRFQFTGMLTFCDIQETLCQHMSALDWKWLAERCQALTVTNAVGMSLMMAHELFGAPVSSEFLSTMGTTDPFSAVKQFVSKNLYGTDSSLASPAHHLLGRWETKSLKQKGLALGKHLISPNTHESEYHDNGTGLRGHLHAFGTRLTTTAENCSRLIPMMLAREATVKKQIEQYQKNTLIGMWLHGKALDAGRSSGATPAINTDTNI